MSEGNRSPKRHAERASCAPRCTLDAHEEACQVICSHLNSESSITWGHESPGVALALACTIAGSELTPCTISSDILDESLPSSSPPAVRA